MLLFSNHKRKNNYHRIDVEVPTKEKNIKILAQNRHSSSQQKRKFHAIVQCILMYFILLT